MEKPLLSVLEGNVRISPPVWLMRQAGRYLPEYREIRKKAGAFLNLCFNPELAAEVTLQPIRRFGFDAAIIFSDILVIPYSLGSDLDYLEGEGPKLSQIKSVGDIENLKTGRTKEKLCPVFEALKITAENIPEQTTLIGFAGAPWTVATYMIEGGSSRDFSLCKKFLKEDKKSFLKLIDILSDETIEYLCCQIEAGAEVIQLFDSWASAVGEENFREIIINPARKIISGVKLKYPDIKFIGFPKDIGDKNEQYLKTGIDALCIGSEEDREKVARNIQTKLAVQGNLDPVLLAEGDSEEIKREVLQIKQAFKNGPHIFNLGHGILPHTPIENVELMIEEVRNT